MQSREELLRKLVQTNHLNVPERKAVGEVSRFEIAELVKSILLQRKQFPPIPDGDAMYEGVIMTIKENSVEMVWQRPGPITPRKLVERSSKHVAIIDEAINEYIRQTWPKGIDGIPLT